MDSANASWLGSRGALRRGPAPRLEVRAHPREPRYRRRAIVTQGTASIEFAIEVPDAGRFVVGLGTGEADAPVRFRVSVGGPGADRVTLVERLHDDGPELQQLSVDLSPLAGDSVLLILESETADSSVDVLWSAPTITNLRLTHDQNGGLIDPPEVTLVTDEPEWSDWGVDFSPDGRSILFSRVSFALDTQELFLVSVDGGEATPLGNRPAGIFPSRQDWSSATGSIAFTGFDSENRTSIWTMADTQASPQEVSHPDLSDQVYYPSWYPDGRRLALVDYAGGQGGVLKLVDLENGTVRSLTDRTQILAGMPTVSPDGSAIAFAGQRPNGEYDQSLNQIWILSGGELFQLDPEQGRTPAWSPDGRWIAFVSNRGSPNGNSAVFAVPVDGGRALQITPFTIHVNHPSWSPTGTELAFSTARNENWDDPWHVALVSFNVRQVESTHENLP